MRIWENNFWGQEKGSRCLLYWLWKLGCSLYHPRQVNSCGLTFSCKMQDKTMSQRTLKRPVTQRLG